MAAVDEVRTDQPDHGVLATITPLPAYMIHSYQEYVGVQISVAVMLATMNPWLMERARFSPARESQAGRSSATGGILTAGT